MIDVINNKFFHLHNSNVSYIFYVMQNGQLGHLYYGKDLGKLSFDDLNYLIGSPTRSADVVDFDINFPNFSLAAEMQEFPVYGIGDFREGALSLSVNNSYLYPNFKYVSSQITYGKKRGDHPSSFGKDAENLIIELEETDLKLKLVLTYSLFSNSSAIVRKAEIINQGKQNIRIENIQSNVLSLPVTDYDFLQLSGAWLKERHIHLRSLSQGITKIESLRGASGHEENPFVALVDKKVTNNSGEIYASNLIYSGNFIAQVQVDQWNTCRLTSGINPETFSWQLRSNESFTSPEGVLFYTINGYNGLIRRTHNFVQNHIISPKWNKKPYPIIVNNWEATYFDFDEKSLKRLVDKSATIGAECFVLDDGWFGKRNNSHSSLGNWTVNKEKFPHGLKKFSDYVHNSKMKFGLWFEPEMISADTPLFKKHPDWVVHHPYPRYSIGRHQYVLDFCNPEVVDNIFSQIEKIIQEAEVDYIKWDMNRNITEAYSPYLTRIKRPQGEFFHRYIQGVYDLYQRLLKKFPSLLIEGCASGGGRFDLGILYYSPKIWPSDDSDAVERLDIMTGTLLAYPLSTFVNHVSAVPNEQIFRETNLKFRQDVACFGSLGYELDLNKLSDDELKEIQKYTSWYKSNRTLLNYGNFYQISPLIQDNVYSWAVANGDKQIVGFYRKLARPNETLDQYLPLSKVKLTET